MAAAVPTSGQVLTYNSTISQWQALAPATSGTVTSVVSGTGLVAGTITNNGTVNVDVGTAANQVLQLTVGSQIPSVDGYLVSNANAYNIRGKLISTNAVTDAQVLIFNSTTSTWVPGNLSGDTNVTNLGAVTVAKIQGTPVAAVVPTSGQVLTYNSTISQWQALAPATSGTVTSVVSGTGSVAGTITNNGTVNVDVGTSANKILQLTVGSQIPSVDGYLVTNTNSYNIRGTVVAAAAPTAGQVLTYNSTISQWQALAPATSGSVTSVVSGTGLVAGTITNNGTVNVDVGTAANQVLQLTIGSPIPSDDGYLVSNTNAYNSRGKSI